LGVSQGAHVHNVKGGLVTADPFVPVDQCMPLPSLDLTLNRL